MNSVRVQTEIDRFRSKLARIFPENLRIFPFQNPFDLTIRMFQVIGAVFGYSIYQPKPTHKPLDVEEGKGTELKELNGIEKEDCKEKTGEEEPLKAKA